MSMTKVFRSWRHLVVLTSLAIAKPATAEVINLDGWELDRDAESCLLTGVFKGGTRLELFSAETDAFLVTLQNPNWRSITHQRMYDIEVEFDEEGPWKLRAMGWVDSGERDPAIAFTRSAISANGGDLFVKEFAAARSMRISIGSRRIDRLSLAGSLKAVAAFLNCLAALPSESQADDDKGVEI